MRGAQAGATVKLTYDFWGEGKPPRVGSYLVSEAGSGYRILKARATSRPLRFRYLCLKVEPAEIPEDARVFSLEWNGSDWGSKKRDQTDLLGMLSELGAVEEVEAVPLARGEDVDELVRAAWAVTVACETCGRVVGHEDGCEQLPVALLARMESVSGLARSS